MAAFWKTTPLGEMTREQWESLCDGCGLCCLVKLEDADTGETHYTDVACHLLDLDACRCTRYGERRRLVPDCVELTPDAIETLQWMPASCAYRLVYESKPLPDWHPLVCGDPQAVHRAGISVRGRAVSEYCVTEDDLRDHLVDWMNRESATDAK
jgi:hypothetical protein